MQRESFFVNKSELENAIRISLSKCKGNEEDWAYSVYNQAYEFITKEDSNIILFNNDGRMNISIASFYKNKIRLHQCKQSGLISNNSWSKQFRTIEFMIPNSVNYIETVEINNEIIVDIKVQGREDIIQICIDAEVYALHPITQLIFQ